MTSQIPRGREMAVFLHEVGAHMGFDNILKKPDREALLQTIKDMAQTPWETDERSQAGT